MARTYPARAIFIAELKRQRRRQQLRALGIENVSKPDKPMEIQFILAATSGSLFTNAVREET